MAGHSVPIDFWVDPLLISNPVERESLLQEFLPLIEPFSGTLNKVFAGDIPGGNYIYTYASEDMSLFIKLYSQGLFSTTLDYFVEESFINHHKIANDDGRKLEKQIQEKFKSRKSKVLTAIKRAPPINPYFTSSDDRILEYDVDKMVFEKISEYQKVQIVHTKSFGNLLLLDDLQNLSESDLPYTHGLMNKTVEDFRRKEILILGGGDGALLWELLKEDPTYVTMIDIDEVVVTSCQQHMSSACGNCMNTYKGKNYEIIIGDAISYMENYIKQGNMFDYVFGDLTDIPLSESPKGEHWDFMRTIINLGTQCLKPGTGKYMTHAIGIQCESALNMFEEQIQNLDLPVEFTRTNCFVPSFMENWCFYQLTPKPSN